MNAMILTPGEGKHLYLINIFTGMPDNSGKVVLDPMTDEAAFKAMVVYAKYMPDDSPVRDEINREIVKWRENWRQIKEASISAE